MKKIKLTIISMVCLCFVQSCSDYLDVIPENTVTFENFFNTDLELYIFLNSTRNRMSQILFSPFIADIHNRGVLYDDATNSGLQSVQIKPENISFFNNVGGWQAYYGVVADANVMLRFANDANIPQERKDFYNGTGYFYRAWGYFQVSKFFGEAPIIRFDGDVGVRAKSSFAEVIDFAIENAEKAVELLPTADNLKDGSGDRVTTKDIPSKEAAQALLAYAYAWKGTIENKPEFYEKSIEAATAIINESTAITLAANPEEVVTSVMKGDSDESIFEAAYVPDELPFNNVPTTLDGFLSFPVNGDGEGNIKFNAFKLNNTTVDAMYTNGDLRKNAYFYDFEAQKAKDVAITGGFAYPYKFREGKIQEESYGSFFAALVTHAVVYRLTDIILLRAECYAKMGNDGEAIQDMNTIRMRAEADLYTPAEGDVQLAVFKEREKELLWENKRWFDVIRNDYIDTELDPSFRDLSDQDIVNGALFLPTPSRAFRENPLMTQNIFWLGFL